MPQGPWTAREGGRGILWTAQRSETAQFAAFGRPDRLLKGTKARNRRGARALQVFSLQQPNSSFDSYDEEQAKEQLEKLSAAEGTTTEAKGFSVAAFIAGAFLFGAGIWAVQGPTRAEEFFAGYLLEQSLSVDNLFVFILVFKYFKTPLEAQGKVLTWGLFTAAILRLSMILVGVELVENFKVVLLGFAGLLLYSSYNLLTKGDEDEDDNLSDNQIVAVCRKVLNVSTSYDGDKFFTMENGIKRGTPLLLALAVIEITDVVFAVDSIPAVFGVTSDPFIIWTSNMWALLSLRSLFAFVAVALGKLPYLDKAIAVVLAWVSLKLGLEYIGVDISTPLSLGVVATTLTIGVAASLAFPKES